MTTPEDQFYIDGLWVNRETVYLLAAAGRVSGGGENGWSWTVEGSQWVAALLEEASRDHYRLYGSERRGSA